MNNTQSHQAGYLRRKSIIGMVIAVVVLLALTFVNPLLPAMAHPQLQESPTGNTYYVDAGHGNDANPGTQAQPWKTIQKAANTLAAGDTVNVLPGNYSERVQVTRSGSIGSPITYLAQGNVIMEGFTIKANYITIQGFEITDTPNSSENGVGIFVQGSYCDLENNYIHFATRGGILLFTDPGNGGQTTNCAVRNNRLYRNSQNGITLMGRNHIIEGNEVWGSIQYHPNWANPPSYVDADGIRFFGTGHIIRKNYIHDILYSDDENIGPHIDCFQTWSDTYHEVGANSVIEQNICINLQAQTANEVGQGFMIEGGASNLIIRNNIIRAYRGFNALNTTNLTIDNNVFTNDLTLSSSYYPAGITMNNAVSTTIMNNIFYDMQRYAIEIKDTSTLQSLSADYNCIYRSDGHFASGTPNPHDLWQVDPKFVDPSNNNFHIQIQSPVIDAGSNITAVNDDFDGNPRPQGPNYDMGPYELPSGPPPQPTFAYSVYLPLTRTRR